MRKIVTASMVAAAALFVTACGGSETTNTTDANAMVMDTNATDTMEGTTNDTMTMNDSSMGAMDNSMMNGSMDNAMMNSSTTTTTTNTTTNAM